MVRCISFLQPRWVLWNPWGDAYRIEYDDMDQISIDGQVVAWGHKWWLEGLDPPGIPESLEKRLDPSDEKGDPTPFSNTPVLEEKQDISYI